MNHRRHLITSLVFAALLATPAVAQFGESSYVVPLEDESIQYEKATPRDAVTALKAKVERGEVKLSRDEKTGYLRSLLKELKVPESSQMLVFSKTSLQLRKISPSNPRALYFNDDIYVGYVRGSDILELSAVDPTHGAIFYTFGPNAKKPGDMTFTRDAQCLQCHHSPRTAGVPGHIIRSLHTDSSGFPLLSAGSQNIDHRSPLEERWGGWYVTGTHAPHRHMGNVTADDEDYPEKTDFSKGANVTDLSRYFDAEGYLTGHSDIVALLVHEHQTRMHNLLTLVNYEARMALRYQAVLNKMLKEPEHQMTESTQRRFKSAAEALLKYMLFVEEAPLKGQVKGTSTFAVDFAKLGPRDKHGRSLRDFDLSKRVFKHPCSFLIYSDAFDELPTPMRDYVLRWLFEILTGQDQSEVFKSISGEDRAAILAILRETKQNLPGYWKTNERD